MANSDWVEASRIDAKKPDAQRFWDTMCDGMGVDFDEDWLYCVRAVIWDSLTNNVSARLIINYTSDMLNDFDEIVVHSFEELGHELAKRGLKR